MVGTRQLARLLDHAQRRQVKVVLVGDPHQLPEIDAGGLFRALATRLPTRRADRQPPPARSGGRSTPSTSSATATSTTPSTAYRDHGRIVTAGDADAAARTARGGLVARRATGSASTSTIMVALRRTDVDDLNARARARMAADGRLTGPTLDTPGGPLPGRRPDRLPAQRPPARRGQRHPRDRHRRRPRRAGPSARPATTATRCELPADYLDAGHVTHGYAITGHKAQGLTVDHTFVLGSDALYREWGYVALSRGRHTNRLYLHPNLDGELDRHGLQPDPEPLAALPNRLTRSRAEAVRQPGPGGTVAAAAHLAHRPGRPPSA